MNNWEKRTAADGLADCADYAANMAKALARIREIADFPNTPGGDMLPDLMGRLETIWKIANGETEQSSQGGGHERNAEAAKQDYLQERGSPWPRPMEGPSV